MISTTRHNTMMLQSLFKTKNNLKKVVSPSFVAKHILHGRMHRKNLKTKKSLTMDLNTDPKKTMKARFNTSQSHKCVQRKQLLHSWQERNELQY